MALGVHLHGRMVKRSLGRRSDNVIATDGMGHVRDVGAACACALSGAPLSTGLRSADPSVHLVNVDRDDSKIALAAAPTLPAPGNAITSSGNMLNLDRAGSEMHCIDTGNASVQCVCVCVRL